MKIIVQIDFSLYTDSLICFSHYTDSLIKAANSWADWLDAELLLVHEVPRLVPAMADFKTRNKIIEHEKDDALSKLKTKAEKKIPGHISTILEVTDRRLQHFLPQLMSEKKQRLIMLGLKGTGLLKKIFIGNVATQIINELNTITVGVPLKVNRATPENLIIPVNPKYSINEDKLDQLLTYLRPSLKNIDFILIDRSGDQENLSTNYLKELTN